MDHRYNDMFKQLEKLKFHLHDAIDNDNDPKAREMEEEMREIMDDMENGQDPRHIETRLKGMWNQLHEMRTRGTDLMSSGDVDRLYSEIEDMREKLRQFPDYN